MQQKTERFCRKGFLVERFGLLATTIKNAKNLVCQGHRALSCITASHLSLTEIINRRAIGKIVILYHMGYLFTSESVSEGHPDKVADQISDAVLDELIAFDAQSKVACETLVTTGQVVLAGEVKSSAIVDVQEIARRVIKRIGYTKSEYMFD